MSSFFIQPANLFYLLTNIFSVCLKISSITLTCHNPKETFLTYFPVFTYLIAVLQLSGKCHRLFRLKFNHKYASDMIPP